MSFSHPSAEPVETSPGRRRPPPSRPAPQPDALATSAAAPAFGDGLNGRPFLDLIAEAYKSEGRTVPDRVLATPAEEQTAPGRRVDATEDSDDVERTTEDRPRRQSRSAAPPLRGMVADPLTSLASQTPIGTTPLVHERPVRVLPLQNEFRSLPVVVGRTMSAAKTHGHAIEDKLEATEPDFDSGSGPKPTSGIRFLAPVEDDAPPSTELNAGELLVDAADVIDARERKTPPPVPEATEIRRMVPPPLPDFAIPPRPIAIESAEGLLTDPHGRVFTAEQFILEDGHQKWMLNHQSIPDEKCDDTDPFAKAMAADVGGFGAEREREDRALPQRDQTIELSVGLLEELLLLDDQDASLTGLRTVPDLRVQDLNALASMHGLGFIGSFDDDEHSMTAPTFEACDFYSDWDHTNPTTLSASDSAAEVADSAAEHLPVIVRDSPPQSVGRHRSIVSPNVAVSTQNVLANVDVPDSPLIDVKPATSFTLTGLVLARPTEDGEAGEKRRKAHSIFAAAMKDYTEGRTKAAHTNAMLALAYDPQCTVYRAAIERWARESKAAAAADAKAATAKKAKARSAKRKAKASKR